MSTTVTIGIKFSEMWGLPYNTIACYPSTLEYDSGWSFFSSDETTCTYTKTIVGSTQCVPFGPSSCGSVVPPDPGTPASPFSCGCA